MPHIQEGVTFRKKGMATSFIFGVEYTHTKPYIYTRWFKYDQE